MKHYGLISGDIFVLALVTVIGFASHGDLTTSFMLRMAAVFVPLAIGWLLLAPPMGLFQEAITKSASQLWRPAFVMVFAGSLAAILRGILLKAAVSPTFAIVLSGTAAVGLTLWRLLWTLLKRQGTS